MRNPKPIIAMMYDFDKTLSPKDMQEFSFIPDLGISNPKLFWDESDNLAKNNGMSSINAYMFLMLKKANQADISITREAFVRLGRDVALFAGVTTWFDRIDNYANNHGAAVEHYIISSGIKEIIEGTTIAKHFKEIYASSYYYDANNVAVWPALVVDYTSKTQFLFRINKGCLSIGDNAVNSYTEETDRRIPFRNMIYIGDGYTDVPCMKLVKTNGGKSIAVYRPNTSPATAKNLFNEHRVDFFAGADYSKDKALETIAFKSIDAIIASAKLQSIHSANKADAQK